LKKNSNSKLSLSSIDAHQLLKDLSKNKYKTVIKGSIEGNSMLPWIKPGDQIEIVSSPSKIRFGDVVAFFDNNHSRLVAHRTLGKKNGLLITKGDNCFATDPPHKVGDISGSVTKIYRNSSKKCFSLGPEKYLIACFSFVNLLQILVRCINFIKKQ